MGRIVARVEREHPLTPEVLSAGTVTEMFGEGKRMQRVLWSLGAIVAVGLITAPVPVRAHHAFAAEFDANRPIRVEGVLVKLEWTNPHAWFHLDVKGPDGTVERWMFEAGNPSNLTRRGITKDYVKIGTELAIEGFLSKGIPRRANGRIMTRMDSGKSLFLGSSGTGAPGDGADVSEQ